MATWRITIECAGKKISTNVEPDKIEKFQSELEDFLKGDEIFFKIKQDEDDKDYFLITKQFLQMSSIKFDPPYDNSGVIGIF